jgi:hypothetical protein
MPARPGLPDQALPCEAHGERGTDVPEPRFAGVAPLGWLLVTHRAVLSREVGSHDRELSGVTAWELGQVSLRPCTVSVNMLQHIHAGHGWCPEPG